MNVTVVNNYNDTSGTSRVDFILRRRSRSVAFSQPGYRFRRSSRSTAVDVQPLQSVVYYTSWASASGLDVPDFRSGCYCTTSTRDVELHVQSRRLWTFVVDVCG